MNYTEYIKKLDEIRNSISDINKISSDNEKAWSRLRIQSTYAKNELSAKIASQYTVFTIDNDFLISVLEKQNERNKEILTNIKGDLKKLLEKEVEL